MISFRVMLFAILLAYTAKSFGSSCTLAESGNLDINNFEPPKIYTTFKPRPKKKFKVAFFGDQGLGANPMSVLKMIKDWGAELVVISGDYDYQDAPKSFMHQFTDIMGKKFPLIAAPGNHDILKWFLPEVGYKGLLEKHQIVSGMNRYCNGELGINQYCIIDNMIFVLSGVGTLGSNHSQFIDKVFTKNAAIPWKVCVWHKNQQQLQTGDKFDETGYAVYEICRKHGAFVITSHEHSYERTHLLNNYITQSIESRSNELHLKPGVSFAAVSGLGGDSIRPWRNDRNLNPWWAATASSSNHVNYGALLCSFGKYKGGCKFRDINGTIWDRFSMDSSKNVNAAYMTQNHTPLDKIEITSESKNQKGFQNDSIIQFEKASIMTLARYGAIGRETLLTFQLNLPFNITVNRVHLQLLGYSPSKSKRASIKIKLHNPDTNKPLLNFQNLKSLFDPLFIIDEVANFEHGDVWVSSDLSKIIDTNTLHGMRNITISLSGYTDSDEVVGFYISHDDWKDCINPTLYLGLI